jgi:hypothetical protein
LRAGISRLTEGVPLRWGHHDIDMLREHLLRSFISVFQHEMAETRTPQLGRTCKYGLFVGPKPKLHFGRFHRRRCFSFGFAHYQPP